ncbi:hypothetical protein MSAN_02420600 [Mycena sanguinolenta]|uniref:Uncharacterized protein n=1 Tax=Mycena sanguinolenta TaxID=230812 RepID=A0A8H6X2Z2_9AGAR|nr:hypothetical protein MSAN_02420600 [Mycena sanguinolenta]
MLEVAVYSLAFRAVPYAPPSRFSPSPLPLNASPPHLRPSPSASSSLAVRATTPTGATAVFDVAAPSHVCAPRRTRPSPLFPTSRHPALPLLCLRVPPPFSTSPRPDAHATGLSTQHHPAPLLLESCPPPNASAPRLGPRRRLTRCHRTFRRRRSSPRWKRRQGRDPTSAPRLRLSPSSLPELPLRPSTPPFLFSTPAALDAAVPFLDVTVLDVAGCLFGTRYCHVVPYRIGHFHVAVCAARLTPATTVSDTAPLRHATCVCRPAFRRRNPWPHDLTVAFDAAGRLCVRWKEAMICRSCPPSTSHTGWYAPLPVRHADYSNVSLLSGVSK